MFFKKFDFLSPEIYLFYNGFERHSSIFSGILSLLLFIFILFLIVILSIDFIYKKNPTAYYYNKYIDDVDVFHLNSTGIFHFLSIGFQNNTLNTFDNRAISIIGTDVTSNEALIYKNSEMNHFIYENCMEKDIEGLKNKKNIYEQLKNFLNSGYCMKKYYDKQTKKIYNQNESEFMYPYLEHGASNDNNKKYGVYIKKCENDTILNNNSCYSDEKIEEYINNKLFIYIFYFLDSNINVQNFKNPIEYNLHNIANIFNTQSITSNHLNFHPLKIRTTSGIFLDEIKEDYSFKFDSNEKIVNSINNRVLGSIHLWIQNEMDIYERLYKKVQDIAGGVDGIVEIFVLFIKFFNLIFFNDFQVLNDFNKEIEKRVEKFESSKLSKFKDINKKGIILNSQIKTNNYILSPANKKLMTKNLDSNSEFNLMQNKNNNLNTLNNNKFKIIGTITKIESSFRKIKRFELLCGFGLKLKKNNYISFLINKREKILSEENLIKQYILLKKLKEIIINIILVKYKNFKDEKSLIELDNNNKLKTLLSLSGFLKREHTNDKIETKIKKN